MCPILKSSSFPCFRHWPPLAGPCANQRKFAEPHDFATPVPVRVRIGNRVVGGQRIRSQEGERGDGGRRGDRDREWEMGQTNHNGNDDEPVDWPGIPKISIPIYRNKYGYLYTFINIHEKTKTTLIFKGGYPSNIYIDIYININEFDEFEDRAQSFGR